MKNLESGQNKIQKICDSIRRETLDPAKKEAEKIIEDAKIKAVAILREAEEQAQKIHAHAKAEIEQERNVFQSSLAQASKQSIEALKQEIEKNLFDKELEKMIKKDSSSPQIIANLIGAMTQAIEKEGLKISLEAVIPEKVSAKEIASLLTQNVLNMLNDHKISLGKFEGGAQLKLVDNKITLDITDISLKELLANYVRKDFRKMIFAS